MSELRRTTTPRPSLIALISRRALIVWVVLIVLTLANPVLGVEGPGTAAPLVGAVILTLAVVKVRFVGLDFMELRHAPAAMRWMFEAYCLILWAALTACFLWL